MFLSQLYIIRCLFIAVLIEESLAWGTSDKVKLRDVETLTLYSGRMTTGRRSSPVSQIKCVGGNAGCKTFTPQVVQCYNRGFDGTDVQWECKSDMDNEYRFGQIQVSCEGYDYANDPYILTGSCGLEYTIDLTKQGMNQQGGHNYYENQQQYGFSSHKGNNKSSYLANIACLAVIGIIIYAIYKTCITPYEETRQRSTTNQDYPDSRGPGSGSGAPPPGFRRNYYPDQSDTFNSGSDSCSGGVPRRGGGLGGGAGGFWTGAATGGLLGYMFGARNNTAGYSGGYNGGYSQGFGTARRGGGFGGFGGDSWGGGGGAGFSGGGASSSGSRSSSGFGGTSRR